MTLEESILFYEEQAKKCNNKVNQIILGAERCEQDKQEYTQLAEWLKELAERRKLPEIIRCGECRFREIRGVDGFCDHITGEPIMVKKTDHCSWAERKTNDKTNKGSSC